MSLVEDEYTEEELQEIALDLRLTPLREQLNLDCDRRDNALLLRKLQAAEEWVANQIGKPLADFEHVPATLTEATLQLASYWFEQREAVVFGNGGTSIPFGVMDLIRPYREWEL